MAVKQFKVPFALSGDRTVTPDALQPSGAISFTQGWGPNYELADTDPAYRPVGRQEMNGLFFQVTAALGEIQGQGYPTWDAAQAPYVINAKVRSGTTNWRSAVANNSSTPGANSDWVNADPAVATQAALRGAYSNLKLTANGISAPITVTADELVVKDASGVAVVLSALNLSASLAAAVGAGGLDSGVKAASTWYAVWVIYNGTTTNTLLSLSGTAPTMPSGYTYRARVGWVKTDASGNTYPLAFRQAGSTVELTKIAGSNVAALPVAASGATGGVMTTVSVSSFIPSTAVIIKVVGQNISGAGSSLIAVAPSTAYVGGDYMYGSGPTTGGVFALAMPVEILLQGTNIAWANTGSGADLKIVGWTDNL